MLAKSHEVRTVHATLAEFHRLEEIVFFGSDILLISDDVSLRQTLDMMLRDEVNSPVRAISGSAAIQEVVRRAPRLVLVHDRLRSHEGMQVCMEVLKNCQTKVVLIASDASRAADAYEVGIHDFLMLPLRRQRVLACITRALSAPAFIRKKLHVIGSGMPKPPLRFKSRHGFIFVQDSEIIWISAAGNYLELHCVSGTHRVRGTLLETCARLENHRQFLRIHRSIVVNAEYLREIRSWGVDEYVVVLDDAKELPVSRKEVVDEWVASARGLPSEPDSDSLEDAAKIMGRLPEGSEPAEARIS